MRVAADYFDGQISRSLQVTLDEHEDLAKLNGNAVYSSYGFPNVWQASRAG